MATINFPEEHPLDELLSDSILTELLSRQLSDRAHLFTNEISGPVSVIYTFIALTPDDAVYDVTIEGSPRDLAIVQRQLDVFLGNDPTAANYQPTHEIVDD